MSMPWDIQTGALQGSILSSTLYSLYINDTPEDGGRKVVRDVGIPSQHYTASQPSKPRPEHLHP